MVLGDAKRRYLLTLFATSGGADLVARESRQLGSGWRGNALWFYQP